MLFKEPEGLKDEYLHMLIWSSVLHTLLGSGYLMKDSYHNLTICPEVRDFFNDSGNALPPIIYWNLPQTLIKRRVVYEAPGVGLRVCFQDLELRLCAFQFPCCLWKCLGFRVLEVLGFRGLGV